MIEPEYQKTLDYIFTFVDYSRTKLTADIAAQFNLDHMREFLRLLGSPQEQFRAVHITGTKGKGSTSVFIASALQQAGYRVGLYTSPHLFDYNERIQINRQPIAHQELVNLVNEIKPAIARVPELTTFEITTAAAFLYFAQQKVEIAVIEVGLGGRLDATNVIDPLVSVITAISYDHQAVLGNTLTQIATEKAGIIKPGKPVILSSQVDEAMKVLVRTAEERGCALTRVGKDVHYTAVEHDLCGQSCWLWKEEDQPRMDVFLEHPETAEWQPMPYQIPLLGGHQLENVSTAWATLQVLRERGYVIPEETISAGFKQVNWPCRFEVISRKPLVILDSAHNRDSALKLRLTLDDYLPGKEVLLIFGASGDKDVTGMLTELLPRVNRVYSASAIHPRALSGDAIVAQVHRFGHPVRSYPTVADALDAALRDIRESQVILATGSIFLAAKVREIWMMRSGSAASQ